MSSLLEHPAVTPPRTFADVLHALGDIDAGRVRWDPLPGMARLEDAIRINEEKATGIVECVDGILVEKIMGFPESILAGYLLHLLRCFVDPRKLGIVTGADGMMRLSPTLLRIPDVSFLSWERMNGTIPMEAAPALAPDLAIEVVSPGNRPKEMSRKCEEYFEAGTIAVWMVCRQTRSVAVYSSPENCETLKETDVLTGGTVLPGFAVEVRKLFEDLERTRA